MLWSSRPEIKILRQKPEYFDFARSMGFGHLVSFYEYTKQETPRPLFKSQRKPSSWLASNFAKLKYSDRKSEYFNFARSMGFEPTTPAVTGQCSNQLSYDRMYLFLLFMNHIRCVTRPLKVEVTPLYIIS